MYLFRPENISEKYRELPFPTRRNAITDDYEVSQDSLGIGINGKVLTCFNRQTKRKCALKVNIVLKHSLVFIFNIIMLLI